MAERMGMSRPGIQKIERGSHTSTQTLMAYADRLGYDFVTIATAWKASHSSQNNAYHQ
jgi:transcriptional regulator with XRE-family HTH domain